MKMIYKGTMVLKGSGRQFKIAKIADSLLCDDL